MRMNFIFTKKYFRLKLITSLFLTGALFAPLLLTEEISAAEVGGNQEPPATVLTTDLFQKHAGETDYLNLPKIGNAVVADLIIGKPPQPGTPAFDADVASRVVVYDYASPEEIDKAQAAQYGLFSFASILGDNFNPDQLPKTAALFAKIDADLKVATDAAKGTFRRHHPLRNGGFCYPSDHAANMFVYAQLLTEIYPEQKDGFCRYAKQLSQDRVILGGHYPADIVAGQIYGVYLATQLLKNPLFQKKWNEAKEEIIGLIPADTMIPTAV